MLTYGVRVIAGSFGITVTGRHIFGLLEVEANPLLSAACPVPKRIGNAFDKLVCGKSILRRVCFLGPEKYRFNCYYAQRKLVTKNQMMIVVGLRIETYFCCLNKGFVFLVVLPVNIL